MKRQDAIMRMIVLAIACTGVLCGGRGAAAADIAQDAILAWNFHDPAKVAAMFTNDATLEDAALGAVNHGPADIRKFAEQVFAMSPDIRFNVTSSFMQTGHGYVEWTMAGTDVGMFKTNKRYEVRGASVVEGSPEKVTRETDYWDMATLMKQLGQLSEQPK